MLMVLVVHLNQKLVSQMASYTMELRNIIEQASQNDDTLNHRSRIEIGRSKLFDFEYPIFDPSYKGVFETNFIRNFYMREIGFETEGLFKFNLESWLLINMPYFNKMFESELMVFDPLMNSKMETTYNKTRDTDGTVDTSTNGDTTRTNKQTIDGSHDENAFNRQLESDTPDKRLAITTADGAGVIEYASKIGESSIKSDGTSTSNVDGTNTDLTNVTGNTISDITETEEFVQTKTGKTGSVTYSKMLMEYRQTLLRIEKEIFKEMQQLFMLVY
jgi:hypothetical protein